MERLAVKNAAFSYKQKIGRKEKVIKEVFEDISLSVKEGEILCIVGPNGCGKSTLIDCLLGLNRIDAGEIIVAGSPLKSYKPKDLARHLAYVPQNHKMTFGYTVLDIVTMGRTYEARMFQPPSVEEKEMASRCLEMVGLKGFEERDYKRLSGGELQLVLIARALCQQAEVIIMDEPTAHLDFRHELKVMEIISKLVKEEGITVIMATHFLNQAFYLENAGVPTRVALMNDRKFDCMGTPSEVLTEDNLENIFNIVTEVVGGNDGDRRKYIIPLYNK